MRLIWEVYKIDSTATGASIMIAEILDFRQQVASSPYSRYHVANNEKAPGPWNNSR